jgi:pyridoxamine 5'-phosphate oxidase
MIEFNNLNNELPYLLLKQKYDEALKAGQKNIEAISISSYNKETNEVDSRFVNLKYVIKDQFIFFTNYNAPKSVAFKSHNQISAILFWPSINIQIRIKSCVVKTDVKFNKKFFKKRSAEKNALAIASKQSQKISSYEEVIKKYMLTQKTKDLNKCPDYWGGFSFKPYYFEFWEGHKDRINKRKVFEKTNSGWNEFFLEP